MNNSQTIVHRLEFVRFSAARVESADAVDGADGLLMDSLRVI
jgi:hypothetical protein